MKILDFVSYFKLGYRIVRCPICGKLTLDNYYICSRCGWEYDGTKDLDEYSDCNSGTIRHYKESLKN